LKSRGGFWLRAADPDQRLYGYAAIRPYGFPPPVL
jgi:hypothetical protein